MDPGNRDQIMSLESGHIGNSNCAGNDLSGSDYGFGTPSSTGVDTLNSFVTDEPMDVTSVPTGLTSAGNKRPSYNHTRRLATRHGLSAGVSQTPSPTASTAYRSSRIDLSKGGHILSGHSSPDLHKGTSPDHPYRERQDGEEEASGDHTIFFNSHGDNGSHFTETPGDVHPPSWSELKTKAGKERKRLPLACIACRRKKIRCSGEKPACKHCLRSRIPCVYKITARRAAPRTDYMAMLDKRLKRMEDRVIRIIPEEDQQIVATTARGDVRPPVPSSARNGGSGQKKRDAEQAFDQELDRWAGEDVVATAAVPRSSKQTSDDQEKHGDVDYHGLLLEGADALPPKELQEHLAEIFFDFVYGQSYHLLHKPSFMRNLARGTVPPVLVLSVCAIAARFSDHPAVRTDPTFLRGELWAAPARKIALSRFDTPNITILITFLILGLHEFGTCQGGRSWMFGGMAQRMAYALRLHQDLNPEPRQDPAEQQTANLTATDREVRRRTMWGCFLMDRFNSSGTDRPLFVAKQYIRAQLPIKESYFQMEITGPTEDLDGHVSQLAPQESSSLANAKANMGVAAYLIRLVSIWGQIIHYLNLGGKERDTYPPWHDSSVFQGIKRAVDEWLGQLPRDLHYSTANLKEHASEKTANQFLLMHIIYHQVLLFMHRFALPAPGVPAVLLKDMPNEYVQASSKAALEAANEISRLVHEAMDYRVVAPFAGYCAFYSSTVHINGAFSKNPILEASSKQNLAWNVKYLTKMKKYWGMFHYMTENLRDLYRRHADAARNGDETTMKSEAGAPIFQYGDWFDRYPHGVSKSDFDEPSTRNKDTSSADGILNHKSDLQTVEEFFSKLAPPSRAATTSTPPGQAAGGRKKKRTKSQAQSARPQRGSLSANNSKDPPSFQALPSTSSTRPNKTADEGHIPVDPDLAAPLPFPSLSDNLSVGLQASSDWTAAQYMSQLDRQMVLNSYHPGSGHVGAMLPHLAPVSAGVTAEMNPHGIYDSYGFDAYSDMSMAAAMMSHQSAGAAIHPRFTHAGAGEQETMLNNNNDHYTAGGATAYWGEPSTAWFMPFNVDPPGVRGDAEQSSSSLAATGNDPTVDWTSF